MSERVVTGLSELQKFLDELPAKMEANIMRSAMRAGAKVILTEARAKVPVAAPSGENARLYGAYAGALRDSLRITTSLKAGTVKAVVRAGNNKKDQPVFYAHFVEFGTAAHRIMPQHAKALFFGGHPMAQGVNHPGAVAKPYMRPAMYSQATAALVAVGEKVKARLTKQGIEGADDIEVSA